MRDVLFSLMPDPVLYHCHAYEIPGNSRASHVFGESNDGWHRDADSVFIPEDATHLSIFVYLSDVREEDGPFEFVLQRPDTPPRNGSPIVSMIGAVGTSFVWHRSYYHRAAPNRGPGRRRLLKVSIQRNGFTSTELGQPWFSEVIRDASLDNQEDGCLFGRFQGKEAPWLYPSRPVDFIGARPTRLWNDKPLSFGATEDKTSRVNAIHRVDDVHPERTRVILIGAGNRVQNNFLPALRYLRDMFDVVGIFARTYSKVEDVARRWGVPALRSLCDHELSMADAIVVSVPVEQNAAVLRRIEAHAPRLDLIIDTPIASSTSEHREVLQYLKRFRTISVAEDYMNFPQFELLRRVVRSGAIGELRNIVLYHFGYLYHGLALVRSFVGFEPVARSWSRRIACSTRASIVNYEFDSGVSATIVGPYRRHTSGGMLIEGTKGIITEAPTDKELVNQGMSVFVLEKLSDGKCTIGFRVRGEEKRWDAYLHQIQNPGIVRYDGSDIKYEKTCGLIEVLKAARTKYGLNWRYSAADALYDSIVSRRAEKGDGPLDPCDTFREWSASDKHLCRWKSKCATFLKSGTQMASTLPPTEKIEVAVGDIVEGIAVKTIDDHIMLDEVELNASRLGGRQWFIFAPHWIVSRAVTRELGGVHSTCARGQQVSTRRQASQVSKTISIANPGNQRRVDRILGVFEHAFLINRDKDTDRLSKAQAQLDAIGIDAERFSAITPADPGRYDSVGRRGCAESHFAVVQEAKRRGYASVLILEDDVTFPHDFTDRWAEVRRTFPEKWELFYFYDWNCNTDGPSQIVRIKGTWCLHCYAVAAAYYDRFLDIALTSFAIDAALRDAGAVVFAVQPNLAGQAEGLSVIRGEHFGLRWMRDWEE
jgi:hypothetical protein